MFSSALGEVEETSKIEEKTRSEINEIENKEKTKLIKTINVISSKVDKQIFFDVIDKIKDEETQRNYLQNLKNLILTENSNKTQEIKLTQYLMDEIFNRFKKIQDSITIEDLKEEIQEIKKQIDKLKQENGQIKQENEQIRNIIQYKQDFVETSNNQDPGIIIPDKQTPIESFINTILKIDFQR